MPSIADIYRPGNRRIRIDQDKLKKRLLELRKRKSQPEVFIIESLSFEDEAGELYEGKILSDVLRMCKKDPEYFYFRTAAELVALAELFMQSQCRYLHISCHGDATAIQTTLDRISLVDFSKIFEGKLNHRRIFFSACNVGSDLSAEILKGRSPKLYSVAAPETKIAFTHAVALWTAFYVKMFDVNTASMSDCDVESTLMHSCELFGTTFSWTFRKGDRWTTKSLKASNPL